MIELERHIEILLLSNDCVIVPGLGGFMAHHVDASYDEEDNLFLPPLRTLGFNPQLQLNDHLLVQSYIEAYDISYPEALRRIEEEVGELRQHIETTGTYELNDIGVLRLNNEGHYEFEPCEAGILTPEYYGLSSFGIRPLEGLPQNKPADAIDAKSLAKANKEPTPAGISDSISPEEEKGEDKAIVIRMSWLRNVAAIAAAVIAFFIIGTPVSNSDSTIAVQQSSMIPSVKGTASETATTAQEKEAALPAQQENKTGIMTDKAAEATAKAEKKTSFTIVMASQTPLHHAEEFIDRLSKKGFDQARTMDMAGTKKLRVVYGTFDSHEEAQQQLRTLRQQDKVFSEAWILEIKPMK